MRKILFGIMGLAMTGAVVTASAYALFTASATINGINFSAGTAALNVGASANPSTNTFNAGVNISGAIPGYGEDNSVFGDFHMIYNGANGSAMTVQGQLTSADVWDPTLAANVQIAVKPGTATPVEADWKSLSDWNAAKQDLPAQPLTAGVDQAYRVYVRMPSDAPNSLQGKSLENVTFTFTGTVEDATPSPTPET